MIAPGYCNEIVHPYRKTGTEARARYVMEDFRFCVIDCDLYDLAYAGPQLTWTNGPGEDLVKARMDRAVARGVKQTEPFANYSSSVRVRFVFVR